MVNFKYKQNKHKIPPLITCDSYCQLLTPIPQILIILTLIPHIPNLFSVFPSFSSWLPTFPPWFPAFLWFPSFGSLILHSGFYKEHIPNILTPISRIPTLITHITTMISRIPIPNPDSLHSHHSPHSIPRFPIPDFTDSR